MLTSIVATLGSGMKGYAEGKRQYEDDEFRKEQQARQRKAWKAEDDLQAGLAEAAKPVQAVSGQIGDVGGEDEEGNPLAPNPTVGTGKVGDTRYASMADATKAAEAANTPEAQAARMADAYAKAGRPTEAMQLRAGAKQGKLADLQLEKAEREALDERYSRELDDLASEHGGFIKGMAAYLTKTQLGGAEGRTFVARPSADGKQMQIVAIGPDGSESVYKSYDNDEKGDVQARVEAMKADTKTKTLFLFDLNKQRTADEQAKARLLAEERRTKAQEDAAAAANKNADTNARKLDLMFQRMGQQSQGGQTPQGLVMGDVDKVLSPLYTVKDEMGAAKVDTVALLAVRSLATRMPAAQVGDAAGAALQAHNLYQRAIQQAGGDHKKAMDLIVAASAPPAAPAPAPAPAPAQVPAAPKMSPEDADEAYVREKLLGRFVATPGQLQEIAKNNANPKFRAAAQRMLDRMASQQQQTQSYPTMTGLGL